MVRDRDKKEPVKRKAVKEIVARRKYIWPRLNFYQGYNKEHNGTNDFGGKNEQEDGATLDSVDVESPQP